MKVLVHHDGQQLGPFSMEEVLAGLSNGTFRPDDLAWPEGSPDWIPVDRMLGSIPPPKMSPTSGFAIASLVLGILSIVGCLSAVAGIPGAVCGHVALSKIRDSGGRLSGSGVAVAGLVASYFGTIAMFLVVLPIMAGIAVPVFHAGFHAAQGNRSLQQAKKIAAACRAYAGDHGGKFPRDLGELVPDYLQDQEKLADPAQKVSGEVGYLYFGTGHLQTERSDNILVESKATYAGHKHAAASNDGSAKFVTVVPDPDFSDAQPEAPK